jgi:hypothetical protein
MKATTIPALVYGIACVACRKQIRFPTFCASFNNFDTYRGPSTGAFYRIDLDRIFYQKLSLDDLLQSVSVAREAGIPLERVPDAMTCPQCGVTLGISDGELRSLPTPQETPFEAILL